MNQVAQVIEHQAPAMVPNNTLTPMAMLEAAVNSGAGIEVIGRLMDFQERWDANQARKAFDAAISKAKADIPPIIKNAKGHNDKRYANFAAIASTVDPILSRHGLSYRFKTDQTEKTISVSCILSHRDGHNEATTLTGPADASGSKNAIQAIGSTLTYLQRYSLVQMLGLAASEDDDGRAAGVNSTGPISDEQAKTITTMLTDTKSDIGLFLKWIGAESISDIPAGSHARAIARLEAKKAKA